MGMYTELDLKVELKLDDEALDAINKLIKGESDLIDIQHPFFKCPRAPIIFHGGSYYFDRKPFVSFTYDDITKSHFLSTCFNLKNYNEEIEKFLDWLRPYIKTYGYIGTYWYEEYDYPRNIFYEDDEIKYIAMKRED